MKFSAFVLLLVCVLGTGTSLEAQRDSWTDLFNGENLDGWIQRGGKAKYEVVDGNIVGTTVPNTPNSFLCTSRKYDDFVLELEFKVHPQLNSGIQIRSNSDPEFKNGRVHGYQVEIDPSERAWSCGIYDEARRGWLDDLKDKPAARYAFRQNDWNHYRVVAVGDRIQTWINGVEAADLTDDKTSLGFIALQVHGVGGRKDPISVSWRNIRIIDKPNPMVDAPRPELANFQVREFEVKKLGTGFQFVEGPAHGPDGLIYFSDIPKQEIHQFDPATGKISLFRKESGKANGLVWTPNDYLLACEGGSRRISMQYPNGVYKVVEKFKDKKLNSPNDITLDGEGGFYFSDPRYGDRSDMEMEIEGVYYVNRGRQIMRVIEDLERPNGLILSNDDKTLYVADQGQKKVFAYSVEGPGKLANKREFASMGSDGMTIDELGNVYLTNEKNVVVYNPKGEHLASIEFPESPSNVTFGGPDRKTMFVTARTSLYSVQMDVPGSRVYPNPPMK